MFTEYFVQAIINIHKILHRKLKSNGSFEVGACSTGALSSPSPEGFGISSCERFDKTSSELSK